MACAQLTTVSAPPNSRSTARQKLTRLTKQQFQELSTDVYDELIRRKTNSDDIQGASSGPVQIASAILLHTVPCLPARDDFHPKRNQARQKLATLPTARFEDLSSDVFFELSRRYPEFKDEVSDTGIVSSSMIGTSFLMIREMAPQHREIHPIPPSTKCLPPISTPLHAPMLLPSLQACDLAECRKIGQWTADMAADRSAGNLLRISVDTDQATTNSLLVVGVTTHTAGLGSVTTPLTYTARAESLLKTCAWPLQPMQPAPE